jgi:hypothetical protein
MFNRTSDELVFIIWDDEYRVAGGQEIVFPYSEDLRVRSAHGEMRFALPHSFRNASREYVESRMFRGRAAKMEIRESYVIYVLPSAAPRPGATPHPNQCEGFPARPERTSGAVRQ